jgi:biopolymer transport protein ExbB
VPAVLAYNWLQRRNKSIAEDLSAFSNDVLGFLASNGAVKPAAAGPAPKAPVKPAATTTAGQTGGVPTRP